MLIKVTHIIFQREKTFYYFLWLPTDTRLQTENRFTSPRKGWEQRDSGCPLFTPIPDPRAETRITTMQLLFQRRPEKVSCSVLAKPGLSVQNRDYQGPSGLADEK